ncbi:Protein TIC 21 like [Actinidia chinensis var. chinensis]|uniref:Protein TIC 21 like n=1 Tax=Actinidia chinensis var. chinensis TaxID=1590841 RepID=A0A2R6R1U4_ACTCC|nr:Protein TIC 21 like [Actinidia chinensis var. chinensis]
MQALLLPTGRLGGAPPSAATNPFPAYLHRPPRPPPSFSHAPTPSLSSSSKSLSLSYTTLRKRPKSLASAPISAAYSSSNDESERAKLAQVSKRLENTAMHFKRLGSLGFWGQLVCTVVAAVILAFSVVITGKITSPATFYATAGGIVAAFISVFWSFGYVRMSDKLRKTANDPSKAPPRADVVKSLKNGIVLNLLGMGAAVLGIQATVGSLVAKALTSSSIPYYRGTSPAYSPVLALDVFLVQASANTIISHFLGLVFSLELLRSVTLPPSESIPVPRTM